MDARLRHARLLHALGLQHAGGGLRALQEHTEHPGEEPLRRDRGLPLLVLPWLGPRPRGHGGSQQVRWLHRLRPGELHGTVGRCDERVPHLVLPGRLLRHGRDHREWRHGRAHQAAGLRHLRGDHDLHHLPHRRLLGLERCGLPEPFRRLHRQRQCDVQGLRGQRHRPPRRRHGRPLRLHRRRRPEGALGQLQGRGVRRPQHPLLRARDLLPLVRLVRLQPRQHLEHEDCGRRQPRRPGGREHHVGPLRERPRRLLPARKGRRAEVLGRGRLLQRHPGRPRLHHRGLRLREGLGGYADRAHRRAGLPGLLDAPQEAQGGRRRGRLPRARRLRHLGRHGPRLLRQPRGGPRRQRHLLRRERQRAPVRHPARGAHLHHPVDRGPEPHPVCAHEVPQHPAPQRRVPEAGRGRHGALAPQGLQRRGRQGGSRVSRRASRQGQSS
mmetsp:Transcript_30655/g.69830  ORF Transcript_30655/g.69830 Transcript_30655/m.69830 type:complete len:440 (+) Transcript_30655:172-1491(+)